MNKVDAVQKDRRKGHPYLSEDKLEEFIEEASNRAAVKVSKTIDDKIIAATEGIAQEAAEIGSDIALRKATENFYRTIGKTVVEKTLVILGVIAVVAVGYLQSKGYFFDVKK